MAEYLIHGEALTAVADAIRQKGGTTELLRFPEGFVSAVEAIETGGGAGDNMAKYLQGELTELVDGNITSINHRYLFYRNTTLTRVELPNAVGKCADAAFYSTTGLNTCILPKVTALGDSCFLSSGLTEGVFSSVETVEVYCFRNCSSLTRLDFPALKNLATGGNFYSCTKLSTLILRGNTMVTLANSNAFYNTPIASGTGYIYVPRDLISTYQADSVWATFSSQFRAIEDHPDV